MNAPTDKGYARVPNGSGSMIYQNHTYNDNNSPITSIENINVNSNLRAYPNPSNEKLYVLGTNEPICIYNVKGEKIYFSNQLEVIDISLWKNGIYFLQSGNSVVKVIKQ